MSDKPLLLSTSQKISRRERILRMLCDGRPHSGQAIAEKLRLSRTAVWKIVGSLRNLGIDITADRTNGYQLNHAIELYNRSQIQEAISPTHRQRLLRIDAYLSIDSTNKYLGELDQELPIPRNFALQKFNQPGVGGAVALGNRLLAQACACLSPGASMTRFRHQQH